MKTLYDYLKEHKMTTSANIDLNTHYVQRVCHFAPGKYNIYFNDVFSIVATEIIRTHYTPRSKYYRYELDFRQRYNGYSCKIETHRHQWQGRNKKDAIAWQELGFVGGYGKPTNTKKYFIVARPYKQ